MSSAHCSCLPLAELRVNYIPSGNKWKDTKKCTNFSTLPCWHPSALMLTQRKIIPPYPCKLLPSQQNAHLALDAGLWSWKKPKESLPRSMRRRDGFEFLSADAQCPHSLPQACVCSSASSWNILQLWVLWWALLQGSLSLTFPEAQAPAWALPVPILLWPCAFQPLSANLDLKSCLNHRNYSYSSSTQRNKHQPFQGRRLTSMQLVKNILCLTG